MKPELIRLDCLSRGGSNVFASLAHCHPNIYSVALRVWARSLNKDTGVVNYKSLINKIKKTKKSIFYQGGFYKDFSNVKYILLEKSIEKNKNIRVGNDSLKSIIMLRNPFSVVTSLNDFAIKYNADHWIQNEERIHNLIRDYYFYLINYYKNNKNKTCLFLFENILKEPSISFKMLSSFLGIQEIRFNSFKEVFNKYGCSNCRGKFISKISGSSAASRVLTKLNKKFPPTPHFYCSKCKLITLGYGGFNPYSGIKKPEELKKEISANMSDIVEKYLVKYLGDSINTKFKNGTINESDFK